MGVHMAHRNLQIPLQKCVFLLYGPSWRACRVPCAVRFVLFLPSTHFSIQFSSLFSKMCSLPLVGSTFLKNGSKHFAFKNSLFGPLKPSNDDSSAHFFGTYRSLSRSVSHFSASVALQNIASGCSPVHFSPSGPLLQQCLSATHLKFPFFCASSAFFLYFCALTPLLIAILVHFLIKRLPALSGKHDFESCR